MSARARLRDTFGWLHVWSPAFLPTDAFRVTKPNCARLRVCLSSSPTGERTPYPILTGGWPSLHVRRLWFERGSFLSDVTVANNPILSQGWKSIAPYLCFAQVGTPSPGSGRAYGSFRPSDGLNAKSFDNFRTHISRPGQQRAQWWCLVFLVTFLTHIFPGDVLEFSLFSIPRPRERGVGAPIRPMSGHVLEYLLG